MGLQARGALGVVARGALEVVARGAGGAGEVLEWGPIGGPEGGGDVGPRGGRGWWALSQAWVGFGGC